MAPSELVDPRIRRTRLLLQHALEALLKQKDFDQISVQDIADAATVNRVTFYDHYTDKFALLECVVARRLQDLLNERNIKFDGTCTSALTAIVLGVCDYLARTQANLGPHLEMAVIAVVRRQFLEGMRQHHGEPPVPPEIIATTLSWAICGAAQEWLRTTNRGSSEQILPTIMRLVSPILEVTHAAPGLGS
jgi:AcrR family transcriptional regulator